MQTQELTSEQKHQIQLAKRRAYYSANKTMIRRRDNLSAMKRYQTDPERHKASQTRHKQRLSEAQRGQKDISDSPDFLQFVYAVMAEEHLLVPV